MKTVEYSGKNWAQSLRELRKLSGREVRVGVVEPSVHSGGIGMASLMAIHEYGSPSQGIPERSILRATILDSRAVVVDILTEGVREASSGGGAKVAPTRLLAAAGRLLAKRMRQRMGSSALAPNKSDRGKRGPLLATGELRRAIRYKVFAAGVAVAEGGGE